jgi:hypothetical protein
MGLYDATSRTRSGRSDCEISLWLSDTALQCKQASGRMGFPPIRNDLLLVVSLGFRFGSVTRTITYNSVTISVLSSTNYPMSGKSSIFLAGSGISINDNTFKGRLGKSVVQQSVWYSDTSVSCNFLLSYNTGSRALVLTSGSIGTLTFLGTYDSPTISQASAFNTRLSSVITISGAIFSPRRSTMLARLGATACRASAWISSSSLFCRSPEGALSSQKSVLTLQQSVSSASNLITFDQPYISSRFLNAPTSGSVSVTMTGLSLFSKLGASVAARFGFSAAQITSWISDTRILSKISAGVSRTLRSLLTAGAVMGGSTTRSITYNAPTFGIQRESPGVSGVIILSSGQNYVNGTFSLPSGELFGLLFGYFSF